MRQHPTISHDPPPASTRRHLGRRRTAVSERLLSQEEAARLAGCSKDTIVRARRNGRLPNARLRDRRWAIPTDDLAAAGLYHPEGYETAAPAERIDTDPAAEPTAVQLARALARVAALEDLVARQDDQLVFLRQLTVDTLAKRGAL
jgi:excisionase family DNA binding protein